MEIVKEENYLTKEQYDIAKDALNKVQDSTEPFVVVDNEGKNVSVIGDANDTEKKVKSYDVLFRFPDFVELEVKNEDNIEILEEKEVDGWKYKNIRFTNVFLAPRHDLKVVKAINELMPFFNELLENGEIDDIDDKKALSLLANFNDDILEAMYGVVREFLGLGEGFEDFITITSLVITFASLVQDFPNVFNEADVFFG